MNLAEITRLLIDAGADVNAMPNLYGGSSTTLGLLVTSDHPAKAGVMGEVAQGACGCRCEARLKARPRRREDADDASLKSGSVWAVTAPLSANGQVSKSHPLTSRRLGQQD